MSIRRPRAPRISFVRKYMRIARACASSMLLHALCVREGERERVAQCASSSCCCCRSRPRARPRLCAHQYTHTHSRAQDIGFRRERALLSLSLARTFLSFSSRSFFPLVSSQPSGLFIIIFRFLLFAVSCSAGVFPSSLSSLLVGRSNEVGGTRVAEGRERKGGEKKLLHALSEIIGKSWVSNGHCVHRQRTSERGNLLTSARGLKSLRYYIRPTRRIRGA